MQEPFAQLIERTCSSAERTVIYRLIRSPQHVRHFASDPIPTDTLQRIVEVAWYGSSVGAPRVAFDDHDHPRQSE
jgi:nitroreductase